MKKKSMDKFFEPFKVIKLTKEQADKELKERKKNEVNKKTSK